MPFTNLFVDFSSGLLEVFILLFKSIIFFSKCFLSRIKDLILSFIFSFEVFNSVANSFIILFSSWYSVRAASPATASILLMPEPKADSDRILNTPISPDIFTCVPPHNSTE